MGTESNDSLEEELIDLSIPTNSNTPSSHQQEGTTTSSTITTNPILMDDMEDPFSPNMQQQQQQQQQPHPTSAPTGVPISMKKLQSGNDVLITSSSIYNNNNKTQGIDFPVSLGQHVDMKQGGTVDGDVCRDPSTFNNSVGIVSSSSSVDTSSSTILYESTTTNHENKTTHPSTTIPSSNANQSNDNNTHKTNNEEDDDVVAQALAIALNANKLLTQKNKINPTTLQEFQYYHATPDPKQRELIQKALGKEVGKDKKLLGLQEEEERKKQLQLEFVKNVNKAKEGLDAFFQKVNAQTSQMGEKMQQQFKEMKQQQQNQQSQEDDDSGLHDLDPSMNFKRSVTRSPSPPISYSKTESTSTTRASRSVGKVPYSSTFMPQSKSVPASPIPSMYNNQGVKTNLSTEMNSMNISLSYDAAATANVNVPSPPPIANTTPIPTSSKNIPSMSTSNMTPATAISTSKDITMPKLSASKSTSIPSADTVPSSSRPTNYGVLRSRTTRVDSPMKLSNASFLPNWQQLQQQKQQKQQPQQHHQIEQGINQNVSKDQIESPTLLDTNDNESSKTTSSPTMEAPSSFPKPQEGKIAFSTHTQHLQVHHDDVEEEQEHYKGISPSTTTVSTTTQEATKLSPAPSTSPPPPPPPLTTTAVTAVPSTTTKAQPSPPITITTTTDPNTKQKLTPLLSTMAWKKRSGYGKYSMRHAWEKRRFELVDTKIMYYKVAKNQSSGGVGGEDVDDRDVDESPPPQATKQKKDFRNILEQAITKTQENISKTFKQDDNHSSEYHPNAATNHKPLSPNEPRGVLDLVKENATVAVVNEIDKTNKSSVFSSTVPPTPFGLYILIKAEPKWKLCFDTQKDQLKWLTALTDLVIQRSVDTYNEELIRHRTSLSMSIGSTGIGGLGIGTVDRSDSGGDDEHATETAGEIFQSPHGEDGRLWTLDNALSSRSIFEAIGDEDLDTEDSVSSGVKSREKRVDGAADNDDENNIRLEGIDEEGKSSVDTKLSRYLPVNDIENFSLKGHKLLSLCFIMNVGFYQAHDSSSSSFWFILFLLNVAFVTLSFPDESNLATSISDKSTQLAGSIRRESAANRFSRLIPSKQSSFHKMSRDLTGESTNEQKLMKRQRQASSISSVVSTDYKPMAGSTSIRLKHKNDSQVVNGNRFLGWVLLDPKDMQVRSHGYAKTKKKIDSPSTLYEVIAVDAFCSDFRVPEIATKVKLPKVSFDDEDTVISNKWHSPDIFVVSIAIPTAAPSMGRPTDDGYGFTITIYYKMKTETRNILKRITDPSYNSSTDTSEASVDTQKKITNAVRLWEEWCRRAPSEPDYQARFKYIPNVHNPKEVGLPSYMIKYSGKPILIKRAGVTGFLSGHPDINAMEFDISLHPFPYLAKKGTAYLKDFFKKIQISFTYVIEGRNDDELPEVVIGEGVELCKPDPEFAINSDDFFAGTAPRSFESE